MTNNRKKFLKNLLTTVSTLAVIAGAANNAGAAALNVTGNVADLAVGNGANLSGVFADGDDLTLTGAFNITTAGNVDIAAIAIGAFAGQTFNVANIVTYGNVALAMNMNITDKFVGGAATHITGTLALNTVAIGNVVGNVSAAVTLTDGGLTMGNAAAAVDVAGGTLTEVGTIGTTLTSTGGTVIKFGNVTGNLDVSNGGIITGVGGAGNIGGTVTLQADAGNVKIGTATGAVSVAGGGLTMGNAAAGVTVSGGELTEVGTIGTTLTSTGGTVIKFGNVAGNLDVSNGGIITGVGGAGNIGGTVTLQADAGNVKIGTATGAVSVAGGGLTMGNATAGVTVSGGTLTEVGTIGTTLTSTGGTVIKFGNVTGNLDVSGGGNITGVGGAGNIGGTVTLQADAGNVKIGTATGAVSVAGGGLTMGNAAAGVTVSGGELTEVGTIGTTLTSTGGTVIKFGNVTGNLDVSGGGNITGVGGAGNIGGTVTLQADAGNVKIGTATGAVSVAGGGLTMGNAAAGVTVSGGELTEVGTIGTTLTSTGGTVIKFGNVTGNLDVSGGGNITGVGGAGNIGGTVTLQADAGNVKIGTATGAVSVAGGGLTMGNAAAGVTVSGGELTEVGTIGTTLTSTGGTVIKFGNVAGNLDVSNGGIITGVGGAGNIGGTVTLQADAGNVKIGTATGAVSVAGGGLTMGNATAGVTVSGGELTEVGTIGTTLTSTGGTVIKFGNVAGNLDVSNGGIITGVGGAGNIGGTVTLQADAGNVKIGTATGAVSVAGGGLTMGNATAGVTVSGGTLTEVGTIGTNLTSTGGTVIKFGNVAGNLDVSNGGIITGVGGAGNIGGTVTLQAGAGNVKIGNAAAAVDVAGGELTVNNIGGAVTLANPGIIKVSGNIAGATNGNGRLVLNGNNVLAQTVANVGNLVAVTNVDFAGKDVTFNGTLNSPDLDFTTAESNIVVTTTAVDLAGKNIAKTGVGATQTLIVDVDQTLTGNIANFGKLHISGDRTVDLNTANFAANITTKTNGEGIVNFNIAGADVISIGGVGARLKELNFNVAKTVGAVYATDISILANGNATFTGVIGANQIKFATAATSTANFGAGNLTTLLVSDGGSGKGIANFAGTNIGANVGAVGARLAQANFALGQVSAINANVYADLITVNGTINISKAATFDGVATFAGARIELGAHDLTLSNGAVAFNGASTITTTINGVNLGNLVAGAGSNITLNGTLAVEVDALAAVPVNGQKVVLIQKNGGTLNLNLVNITVTKNGGAFAQWRQEIAADGSLILTNESQIAEVIREAAVSQGLGDVITEEVAQAFEDFEPGTQGNDIVNVFNTFVKPDGTIDKVALADGQARLANTTANEVVGATFENVSTMTEQINARMFDVGSFVPAFVPAPDISGVGQTQGTTFTPANTSTGAGSTSSPTGSSPSTGSGGTNLDTSKAKSTRVSSNEVSGLAAGDESDRYGIWATPFYSKNTQKNRGSSSGYKSDGYGGTFGFDTRANEEMIVGLAVTAMNTDIKHKDFKSGDKTKVGTILFSAYSNYQFGNNWFGQGVFSVGSSNVKNKENRRISTTAYGIASSEYSSMTFASEIIGGYNHLVNDQLVLTPMFGLGYSRINDSSYKERGSGPQLLSVTKQASSKLDLVGGLRVTGLPFIAGKVFLTPEMHGSIRHDMIGKGAKVDIKIPGLPELPSGKAKLQKTYYNLGASLKASYGMMDYGVAADTTFAKKYVGVNGSVNVRVNF